jgi:peptidoglycan/xylan/chitin deacetylase (PgdA/CDA1 family)
LYVSQKLFQQQLRELREAGYRTTLLDDFPTSAIPGSRCIVLTFDDGFEKVVEHAIEPLAQSGFRAIQFLVSDRLGVLNDWEMAQGEVPERLMDAGQVQEWLAAGHDIGSHTRTHPYLSRLSLTDAKEEITSSKKQLEDLFGRPVRHFCYPFGDYTPAVADIVRNAGYATACTTKGGLNTITTPAHQLRRITVRYPTRSLKAVKQWLTRRKAGPRLACA